jgi:glycosyltransferase involved in cell wall biosynthesis
VDIEHVSSFVGLQHWNLDKSKKLIFKFLRSKYCKKILPHTFASKKSFESIFGKVFDKKLEVVYPAIRRFNFKHAKKDKIRILFIGKDFEAKGGKEVLKAHQILKKRYDNIELVIKSKVPEKFLNNFKEEGIIFTNEIVNREELFRKYYFTSDIFVFPTYIDSFGYVLLEAMAASLPIITTDIFSIPEIVEDNKNGFLIKSPLSWANEKGLFKWKSWQHFISLTKMEHLSVVKQLVEKISLLIEDSSLRKRMGREGRKLVEKGKFSIKERNKKLKEIYEEALKVW